MRGSSASRRCTKPPAAAVAHVWDADLGSPARQIVVAEYVGTPRSESVDVCEGVLLAWDEARQEWRSIHDCVDFYDIEIHGDTLSAGTTTVLPDDGLGRAPGQSRRSPTLGLHCQRLPRLELGGLNEVLQLGVGLEGVDEPLRGFRHPRSAVEAAA